MPTQPTVSVIMPAHNAAGTVQAAIDSVLAQDFGPLEVIVADDASSDGTAGIVRRIARRDGRVRLVATHGATTGATRQSRAGRSNVGAAGARNQAQHAAMGRFIAFLDSDDLWLPGKLQRQLAFQRGTHAALTYTGYVRIPEAYAGGAAGVDRSRRRVHVPRSRTAAQLRRHNVIGCLTAMYDRAQLGTRYFPEDVTVNEDFALWLDLLAASRAPARGLDEPLAAYRVHPAGASNHLSANLTRDVLWDWRVLRRAGAGRLAAAADLAQILVTGALKRRI
ncbi:MAG: glycosyltransferase [Bifidobacteriaceae bacterium]|nr:glycosyltransferase [Bifidobacteriaceae bacterium]